MTDIELRGSWMAGFTRSGLRVANVVAVVCAREDGLCDWTVERIAECAAVSTISVTRAIKVLEHGEHVRVDRRCNMGRGLTNIITPASEEFSGLVSQLRRTDSAKNA